MIDDLYARHKERTEPLRKKKKERTELFNRKIRA